MKNTRCLCIIFRRLRNDGFDPNKLAGNPPRKRIIRPGNLNLNLSLDLFTTNDIISLVELSLVPDAVPDVAAATRAMRNCLHLCNTLRFEYRMS